MAETAELSKTNLAVGSAVNVETVPNVSSQTSSNYQMRPSTTNSFQGTLAKQIVNEVLQETLNGKFYESSMVQKWVTSIADDISVRIKSLEMRRYKHIVQVVLAQQNGAGCKYIARCRWDAESDSQISSYFTNETIACVVSVFGVCLY